jgi:predicted nuclease with TOPRIM domain
MGRKGSEISIMIESKAENEALREENTKLKEYIDEYEGQIRNLENELSNLR